jgi:hypothetical protein
MVLYLWPSVATRQLRIHALQSLASGLASGAEGQLLVISIVNFELISLKPLPGALPGSLCFIGRDVGFMQHGEADVIKTFHQTVSLEIINNKPS